MRLHVFFFQHLDKKENYLPTNPCDPWSKKLINRHPTQKFDKLSKAPKTYCLIWFLCHSFDGIEKKTHQFPIALKFFVCAFITFMISDRVLLSAGVDIIVIIFQKGKLNGISVGDRKKKFNAYRPLKIKRKKVEVNKKKIADLQPTRPYSKIRMKSETRLLFF